MILSASATPNGISPPQTSPKCFGRSPAVTTALLKRIASVISKVSASSSTGSLNELRLFNFGPPHPGAAHLLADEAHARTARPHLPRRRFHRQRISPRYRNARACGQVARLRPDWPPGPPVRLDRRRSGTATSHGKSPGRVGSALIRSRPNPHYPWLPATPVFGLRMPV